MKFINFVVNDIAQSKDFISSLPFRLNISTKNPTKFSTMKMTNKNLFNLN